MEEEYDFSKGKRGSIVPPDTNKVRITIRIDKPIIDYFKNEVHNSGGGNYQTLMNAALREHIEQKKESLEVTLRRIIREELQAVG
ncbi:MAG: BrnA antitoxin family protein [Proteobacteria bacterium]|nr:BrnA antitoxin family protein [Pseudomonadota bacterium]